MSTVDATHYLVIDLEATCSEDRAIPPDRMETIEIGAVLVRASTFVVEDEFQSFVRPVRHPVLLPFCTKLTGITQAMVDGAPGFPEAFAALRKHLVSGRAGLMWGSWGRYDERQLKQDCALHRVPFHMPPHVNLKTTFAETQGVRKKQGMAQALALCGLKLEGAHHRGIDDARNIARMLPWIVGTRRIAGAT
jgi:inhibitor of KinA sporulation pathway (predicted exonuclease)